MDRETQVKKILLILIILWVLSILGIVVVMYLDFVNDDLFWDAIGNGDIFERPK